MQNKAKNGLLAWRICNLNDSFQSVSITQINVWKHTRKSFCQMHFSCSQDWKIHPLKEQWKISQYCMFSLQESLLALLSSKIYQWNQRCIEGWELFFLNWIDVCCVVRSIIYLYLWYQKGKISTINLFGCILLLRSPSL